MKCIIFLAFLTLAGIHERVSAWRFHIEPKQGSMAGGTLITVTIDGSHQVQFASVYAANASQFQVFLTNPPLPRIPCDLQPVLSDIAAIKCKTRAAQQEGVHWVEVMINGRAMCPCTFKYTAALTPTIYHVNPPLGVPGNVITIFGRIMTGNYETYDFNVDYIEGPPLLHANGWSTVCSFANLAANDIYPIHAEGELGSMQCRFAGHHIGSHNVSFSVFNYGKSAVNKDAWLISAKQELFLYQTHSDVSSVVPDTGSLGGGTTITIIGDFFLSPLNVTIAGVPCEISHISPRQITCITGPVRNQSLEAPQAGNRGLLFEVWNETTADNVTAFSLGYKWGIAPSAMSLSQVLQGIPQPFSSRLSGFFVAPETNNYTFWIQADSSASLYFCHSEDSTKKVKIATMPAAISTWTENWEHNWDESWQQKSEKFQLVGGKKYYMEAWQHGKMPSGGMRVGVQIHNTWLNPNVVNTYHREKIEIYVQAKCLPEIQMLSLTGTGLISLSWDNVSSQPIPTNATARQIEMAIEDMISVKCNNESSSDAVLLSAGFEEGLDDVGSEGQLTALTDPFCGRFSSLKPKHLIKMAPYMLTGYDLRKYTHVCFAYKGYIKNVINVSVSYTYTLLNKENATLACLWNYNDSDPESWTFTCTDLWSSCVNRSGFLKDLQLNSMVYVNQIDLFPVKTEDETQDWFLVDEIVVSDRTLTVFQLAQRPSRPGGSLIETVSVEGEWPTFNLSFWTATCATELPLIGLR